MEEIILSVNKQVQRSKDPKDPKTDLKLRSLKGRKCSSGWSLIRKLMEDLYFSLFKGKT